MLDFDKAGITGALSGKEARLAVAFSTACAQRLVNSLCSFEQHEGAKSIAQTTLGALRSYLVVGTLPSEGLEAQLISLIPDEDDDASFAAGVLDDALAALAYSVRASTTAPIESACYAATRALATAFRYSLQFLNHSLLTDSSLRFAMENPVVQRELQRQERDLADIGTGFQQAQMTISLLIDRALTERVLEGAKT
jgi:hypothetical protein